MKTRLLMILFALFVMTPLCYCQLSFGISPGIGFNSAYFGYRINNKIIPYIGIQYMGGNLTNIQSGQEFDDKLSEVVNFSKKVEFSGSLFIPDAGLKYYIKQHDKLQPYFSLNITKPLLSVNIDDGTNDDSKFEEIRNLVKSINKSIWGYEFGFGVEYFVDDNFSIGGEFGYRHLHLKYTNSEDDEFYNPNTGLYQPTVINTEVKFNANPTFSKIALNFYF